MDSKESRSRRAFVAARTIPFRQFCEAEAALDDPTMIFHEASLPKLGRLRFEHVEDEYARAVAEALEKRSWHFHTDAHRRVLAIRRRQLVELEMLRREARKGVSADRLSRLEYVDRTLLLFPETSNRQIARVVSVSPTTVGRRRRALEDRGLLARPAEVDTLSNRRRSAATDAAEPFRRAA